jgi:hypothetical protein
MFQLVATLLNNDIFLGTLCYLLTMVPILGIMAVHSKKDNGA